MLPEKRAKILRELTNQNKEDCEDAKALVNYAESLEDALVEKVEQCMRMRKELRRLNQSVRYINAIDTQNQVLVSEIITLSELLDRDNAENADTDPSKLAPEEDNFPTSVASVGQTGGITVGSVQVGLNESYNEWDLRTRFTNVGKLPIRGVDELR